MAARQPLAPSDRNEMTRDAGSRPVSAAIAARPRDATGDGSAAATAAPRACFATPNSTPRDRPCRLRRLLRRDREARRSGARRQAGDHRRRQARRGLDRLLYRPHLRRALGHADVQGAGGLPGRGRDPAGHGEISAASAARCAADARADAAGRAALDRRGLSRPLRHRARCTAPARPRPWRACAGGSKTRSASRSRSACRTTSSWPRSPPTSKSRAASRSSAGAEAETFLADRPVGIMPGVGAAAQARLAKIGVTLIAPPARSARRGSRPQPRPGRRAAGGSRARRGPAARAAGARDEELSAETTFETDLRRSRRCEPILWRLTERVSGRLKRQAWRPAA